MMSVGPRCGMPLPFLNGISNSFSMAESREFILTEVALTSLLSLSNLLASFLPCVYVPLKRNGHPSAHLFSGRERT